MEPYLNFALALTQGNDPAPELEAIRQLPLDPGKRFPLTSPMKATHQLTIARFRRHTG
jgi:hypothetical protein